jgi:hypothetical protein
VSFVLVMLHPSVAVTWFVPICKISDLITLCKLINNFLTRHLVFCCLGCRVKFLTEDGLLDMIRKTMPKPPAVTPQPLAMKAPIGGTSHS